jgi:hypothetical protein
MESIWHHKVMERAERLAKFIELEAPNIIVNRELGMVIEAALMCGYTPIDTDFNPITIDIPVREGEKT